MPCRSENRAAAFAAFVCALLLAGCEAKITEVVVVVESELRVPDDIDAIEVRVNTAGRMIPGLDAPLMGGVTYSLPLSLGLTSESNAATPFTVVVRGLLDGAEVIRAEASTRFVPGERRMLRIRLVPSCLGITCTASGTTCSDGACADSFIDPQLLPPFVSLDGGVDAQVVDGGPGDAGDGGAVDGGGVDGGGGCMPGDSGVVGAPDGCVPARPNARPTCADDGTSIGPVYFGLRDVIIDQRSERWRTLGWDFDAKCTDALAPMPAVECVSAAVSSDGLNGIDNVFGGQIVSQLIFFRSDLATGTAEVLGHGRNVPVVTLEGWNGSPNDPRVLVSMAYTVDLVPAGTTIPAGGVTVDNAFADPAWDGSDVAYLSSASFTSGGGPALLFDDNAYVAGGMIVAQFRERADLDLPGAFGTVRARLNDFRLTAELVDGGASLRNALLTGRWEKADLLMFLADLGICPDGGGTNDALRAGFESLVDQSMDVRVGSVAPGLSCNAVSTVFPFQSGVRVVWGEVIPVTLPRIACP